MSDTFADIPYLRRFGLALTRDDRFVLDHAAAAALVERLFRQASIEAVDAGARLEANPPVREDARLRAFSQFVRLHRRHVRRLAFDDSEAGRDENADNARGRAPVGGVGIAAAVRTLPLELREALLIVVLGAFTHQEAALALDVSLAVLLARLTKARERVGALIRAPSVVEPAGDAARTIPHLRVVK